MENVPEQQVGPPACHLYSLIKGVFQPLNTFIAQIIKLSNVCYLHADKKHSSAELYLQT